jgi:hypothetical protein
VEEEDRGDEPVPHGHEPGELAPGFFLPVVTARYTAVTAATAGVR